MSATAVLLVIASATAHAGWNFFTKKASWPLGFTWAMAFVGTIGLLPVGAYLLITEPPEPSGWTFVAVSWMLHLAYFSALARGYSDGDLSVVYPIARGSGIAIIPILGVVLLDETMSTWAVMGAVCTVAGIIVLGTTGLAGARFRPAGIEFALLTGLLIASYSVLDAAAVDRVNPILYLSLIGTSGTLGLRPPVLRRAGASAVRELWDGSRAAIVIAGILQVAAYAIVLWVLQESPVAYVGPLREVALVFGVILGVAILGERAAVQRALGAGIIVAGTILIAFAP
ncbi:MAG: EamA family transporter [Dehalococcoidia bacterium]